MVLLANLPILTGKINFYSLDFLLMALNPFLTIILIIAIAFLVSFFGTYLVLSYWSREKAEDSSPPSPKKVSKKVKSLLQRNLADELLKSVPLDQLDPSSIVELQEKLNNGLMQARKSTSSPDRLLDALQIMRNEVEHWVIQQGSTNFDISRQVYDFFFAWYREIERELY